MQISIREKNEDADKCDGQVKADINKANDVEKCASVLPAENGTGDEEYKKRHCVDKLPEIDKKVKISVYPSTHKQPRSICQIKLYFKASLQTVFCKVSPGESTDQCRAIDLIQIVPAQRNNSPDKTGNKKAQHTESKETLPPDFGTYSI